MVTLLAIIHVHPCPWSGYTLRTSLKLLAVLEQPAVTQQPGHREPGEPVALGVGTAAGLALPYHQLSDHFDYVLVHVQVTALLVDVVAHASCCGCGCCGFCSCGWWSSGWRCSCWNFNCFPTVLTHHGKPLGIISHTVSAPLRPSPALSKS